MHQHNALYCLLVAALAALSSAHLLAGESAVAQSYEVPSANTEAVTIDAQTLFPEASCDCPEPPGTLFPGCWLDDFGDCLAERKQGWCVPMGIGAWHWFHEDLSGSNDGYGIEGLRGTYYWLVTADPQIDLGDERAFGGHLEYRLREGDPFRSFFPNAFWSYEAYLYYRTREFGTLKMGQIWKRFGLDWDSVFFGNTPYFDGFKLDPDWGVSWESTREIDDGLKIDRFVQFYFHEDGVNGSFGGADPESVAGYNERNTGVVRWVPTWTLSDESTFSIGLSGLVGEIDSRRTDVGDENLAAGAIDAQYTVGQWRFFGEALQSFGVLNPRRYVSGGPSEQNTNFLVGTHYKTGPVTWRCSYSLGIDHQPYAEHNMVVLGSTVNLTKNVDLYLEYVNEQVSGNEVQDFIEFFNSLECAIYWHF